MSQVLTLKVKGLNTNSNTNTAAEGSLSVAQNISISKMDIAELRRGFSYLPFSLPNTSDRADKFFQFQSKIIVHYNTSQMGYYDEATGFYPYAGTFAHPDPALGRIWSAQANQNLYFTSAKGIQKLDTVTGTPVQAGMYPGLDVKAIAAVNASGWMTTNNQVAYRVIFGISDSHNNLVLGAPSQRAIVVNASGSNQDTSVTFTLPQGITTNHIYQVYRSNLSTGSAIVPDDECQLVYGANPTTGQITAGSVTFTDITPDNLRGAALYTNSSQEGILNSNEMPPFAYDIASYRQCLFFANTRTNQSLILTMISVGGTLGVQSGDTVTIDGVVYTAGAAESASTRTFALVTAGSAAQNIGDTAQSLVRVINSSLNASNTTIYARYLSTATSLPGQIQLYKRVLGLTNFAVTASAHGSAYLPALPVSGTTVVSTNSTNLNGLMYSKQGVPEAVPLLNLLYIGDASKKILRIIPLRDSLMILKEDGLYRLTGTAPGNFIVDLVDSSAICVAPETAVTLNNSIYCLGQQGFLQITDSEAKIISESIEDTLRPLIGSSLSSVSQSAFGISYETDRKYICFLPGTSSDTFSTSALVYDVYTKTFVQWTRPEVHGLVLHGSNDRIVLANPNTSQLSVERKTYSYLDYSDESSALNIVSTVSPFVLKVDSLVGVVVGDALFQSNSVNSIITSIDNFALTATVSDAFTWTPGATTLLKGIPWLMEMLPYSAGNPGTLKHYREGSLIFKQNYFSTASVNFYSELSGSIDKVPFTGTSLYGWGRFAWGTGAPWGGLSRPSNERFYIPTDKQRCDFLTIQFSGNNVWARWQFQGVSLVLNPVSERVSR